MRIFAGISTHMCFKSGNVIITDETLLSRIVLQMKFVYIRPYYILMVNVKICKQINSAKGAILFPLCSLINCRVWLEYLILERTI